MVPFFLSPAGSEVRVAGRKRECSVKFFSTDNGRVFIPRHGYAMPPPCSSNLRDSAKTCEHSVLAPQKLFLAVPLKWYFSGVLRYKSFAFMI